MSDSPTKAEKKAARAVLDRPEHKWKAGPDGTDHRDEKTRDDPVEEE